jgi:hypothetical protein
VIRIEQGKGRPDRYAMLPPPSAPRPGEGRHPPSVLRGGGIPIVEALPGRAGLRNFPWRAEAHERSRPPSVPCPWSGLEGRNGFSQPIHHHPCTRWEEPSRRPPHPIPPIAPLPRPTARHQSPIAGAPFRSRRPFSRIAGSRAVALPARRRDARKSPLQYVLPDYSFTEFGRGSVVMDLGCGQGASSRGSGAGDASPSVSRWTRSRSAPVAVKAFGSCGHWRSGCRSRARAWTVSCKVVMAYTDEARVMAGVGGARAQAWWAGGRGVVCYHGAGYYLRYLLESHRGSGGYTSFERSRIRGPTP